MQVVSLKPVEQLKPRHVRLKPMMLWTIYKLETAQPVHQLRGDPAILGATLIMDLDNAQRFVAEVTVEQLLEEFALPGSLEVMTFQHEGGTVTHPLRTADLKDTACPLRAYGFSLEASPNGPVLARWVPGLDVTMTLTNMRLGQYGRYATPDTRFECTNMHGQKLGSLTVAELDALNNVPPTETRPAEEPEGATKDGNWRDEVQRNLCRIGTAPLGKSDAQPDEPPVPKNVDMLDMWRDEVRRDNTRLGFDDWVKARRGTFVFTVRLTVPFDKPREVLSKALETNIRSALEDSLDVGRIHENASGLDVLFVRVE